MMKKTLALAALAATLTGCSLFSGSKAPKMAELPAYTNSVDARILWRENVGKSDLYALTPAIVNISVYAAGKDGSLVRIDEGRAVWRIKTGLTLSGGVGADSKTVAVASPKGEVAAFASADGAPRWTANVGSEVLAPPAVGDGLVVVRGGDNRLTAFDAADGTRKWVFQRPTPPLSLRATAAPVIDGGFVFTGFPGGKLVAVSTLNGAAVWEGTVAVPKGATELDRVADIVSLPVIAGQAVCAVAFQGRVACFDLGNGNLIWAREMSSVAGLSIDNRRLYVSDDKGAVHALDMASGASLWKQDKLFLRRLSRPLAQRSAVAVADVQGFVHFLNREDGAFIGRLATDGTPVLAPLQAMGGGVLLQTTGGGLFSVEAR